MTERPLPQISLRKFRDEIVDIRQVVEVSRRDPQGNINVLGYWTPYMTYDRTLRVEVPGDVVGTGAVEPVVLELPVGDEPLPRMVRSPEEAAVAVAPTVRAFPKSAQVGKRK